MIISVPYIREKLIVLLAFGLFGLKGLKPLQISDFKEKKVHALSDSQVFHGDSRAKMSEQNDFHLFLV